MMEGKGRGEEIIKKKLELVFIKHYALNICLSPNMAEFAVS